MTTQCEAIIEAFKALGGDLFGKTLVPLADMVPESEGGNASSAIPKYFRVLERVERGKYRLMEF